MSSRLYPRALRASRVCEGVLIRWLVGPAMALGAGAALAAAAPETGNGTGEEELTEIVVTAVIGTYHEQKSYMATKIPMDVRDIAGSLSILNEEAIKDRNTVALSDIFGYVTGATQSQNSINGFSFRGFPNTGSYTQNIQFDGLMGATQKKAATTAANVERLEFLKGPNSVLYGQMNPGGLLNIVSKSPLESAQYSVRGSLGYFSGAYSGGSTNKDLSFDATGPLFNSQHVFYRLVVDGNDTPTSRPGNTDNSLSIYPALTFKWGANTSLILKGEDSQDRRRQDDGLVPIFNGPANVMVPIKGKPTATAAYGPGATWYTAPLNTVYNDQKDWARDIGSAFSFQFQTQLAGWSLHAQGRSVWHVDEIEEFTVNNAGTYTPKSTYAVPTSTLRRQYNHVKNGHRYNYGDVNIYREFGPDSFRNTLMFGLGGGGEGFFNDRIAFGPNSTVPVTLIAPIIDQAAYPTTIVGARDSRTWQTVFGEYISDQIKVGERFNFSIGLRHEKQKTHGLADALNPATYFKTEIDPWTRQLGAVWHVVPAASLYASWSQSVKAQTNVAYDQLGNSTFPPEAGEQYEAGVKLENAHRNANLTLSVYRIDRLNVVVPSGTNFPANNPYGLPSGTAISRLDGKQTSRGYEAELQWQPVRNWQMQVGFAHSRATIEESITNPNTVGSDLVNAPRDTGNMWTRYNLPHGTLAGLGFGAGLIYVGSQYAGDPTTTIFYVLPAWTRLDVSAYYKWKGYDLALNVQNLADRRYIASSQSAITLNPGEQRRITLTMGARF